jgi:hypothetical protein
MGDSIYIAIENGIYALLWKWITYFQPLLKEILRIVNVNSSIEF